MSKKRKTHISQGVALQICNGSEYEKYIALRADLMANIQLSDNKALGLVLAMPNIDMLKDYYLDAICPNVSTPNAPEGYEIFNVTELEHLKYQCDLLRDIVKHKYTIVSLMIKRVRGLTKPN